MPLSQDPSWSGGRRRRFRHCEELAPSRPGVIRGATVTPWRTVGLLVLLPALLAGLLNLTPLAYASPLDPGWVDGECDDAHQGDVVVLIV